MVTATPVRIDTASREQALTEGRAAGVVLLVIMVVLGGLAVAFAADSPLLGAAAAAAMGVGAPVLAALL
ncbi:hypothetical protein HCA61_08200 [Rhodococcus sp. HNM0563]|uniref:hypothetical protein n=1 Tax=unclassified Rhodococcus (in: high G+C Gram-positive bacteria) TaxID=192944 RepID=UPI00146A5716|nr:MULTISPECIES: hypothetical protein [unclassified Rhodococcus (in: high G+C Gram-positive bacteria)]MCK0089803.1 hypothetical protein [Rhodococcus sp. F64268]NLU62248.1 hypothetical protein [Rhodococcus sp. HNM0563]